MDILQLIGKINIIYFQYDSQSSNLSAPLSV